MSKATNSKIVKRGVTLLQSGTLFSALPNILMTEFELTIGNARLFAIAAMAKYIAPEGDK